MKNVIESTGTISDLATPARLERDRMFTQQRLQDEVESASPRIAVGSDEPYAITAGEMVCTETVQRRAVSVERQRLGAHETSPAVSYAEDGRSQRDASLPEELTARGGPGEFRGTNNKLSGESRPGTLYINHTLESPRAEFGPIPHEKPVTEGAGTSVPANTAPVDAGAPDALGTAHATEAHATERLSEYRIVEGNRRRRVLEAYRALLAQGASKKAAAKAVGQSVTTIWRYERMAAGRSATGATSEVLEPRTRNCGRVPNYLPSDYELQRVRELYIRIDESQERGRGLGSSKAAAFRIVAKSEDPLISDQFRRVVLQRKGRTIPPSWGRLLQAPASMLARVRDQRSTMASWVSTPRNRTYVDDAGDELPLECGVISEADDGTLNFYACIPWPFGGDKCSDRFGVKLGRWQLLPVVDGHAEFCPAFDIVARPRSSYRGEDVMALLGRTMFEICVPELWRLERGSWESEIVQGALRLSEVPVTKAWHSKQKNAIERFFDRLWTPASLIRGHVGRDQARYKQVTNLALACEDGRHDPRDHFLSLDEAVRQVAKCVEFVNQDVIVSKTWGRWVPQERWVAGAANTPDGVGFRKLDPSLKIFFSREQRVWTVRKACLGGNVEGPLIRFPVYFQCAELWEFEGCKVKCYFDPYDEPVRGTLVLQHDWRGYKSGHVIARDVEALELPPQAVIAEGEEAGRSAAGATSLAVRKAIAKAVRTETWNWLGGRTTQARDGFGNCASRNIERSTSNTELPTGLPRGGTRPTAAENLERRRNNLREQAALVSGLQAQD
jgi:hypothetical protein